MGGAVNLDMRELTSFLKVAATVPEKSREKAVTNVGLAMAEWQRQVEGGSAIPVNTGALAGAFSVAMPSASDP